MKKIFLLFIGVPLVSFGAMLALAQTNSAVGAPMVTIVDITNVIYPLPLPDGGGPITFTYKITNPGAVALSDVTVTDDVCGNMSGELGDTNGDHLLDPGEIWIYTCATTITKTTAHAATVIAYANGAKAVNTETSTITVSGASVPHTPSLPNGGSNPNIPGLPNNGTDPGTANITVLIWEIFGGVLVVLVIVYFVITRKK